MKYIVSEREKEVRDYMVSKFAYRRKVETVENDGPWRYKAHTIFCENSTSVSKFETCRKHDNATSLQDFFVGRKGC